MKNKVLAVVGMCGSGKTIAVEFFEKQGYEKVYFGGVIYDKMKEANIEITPDSQRVFRENLRQQYGMGVVAKILLPQIKKLQETSNVVLDGLYSWEEYKILKEECKEMKMLAIVTDKSLRYERIANRKDRPFTKEQAEERDRSEIENIGKAGPIAFADMYILNNGDENAYQKDLQKVVKQMEEEEWI